MGEQREKIDGEAGGGSFAARVAGALSSLRLILILIAVLAAGVLAGTILYGRFGSDYAFQCSRRGRGRPVRTQIFVDFFTKKRENAYMRRNQGLGGWGLACRYSRG